MDRFAGRLSSLKPKWVMYWRAKSTPMASSSRTDTRLRDCTSASRMRIGPENLPLSFCGCQTWPTRSRNTTGASRTIVAGV